MEEPVHPSQQADRSLVRLPDGMRERVKEIAAENRRSMNSGLVLIIERALPAQRPARKNGSLRLGTDGAIFLLELKESPKCH
jgi:hypothetical protein